MPITDDLKFTSDVRQRNLPIGKWRISIFSSWFLCPPNTEMSRKIYCYPAVPMPRIKNQAWIYCAHCSSISTPVTACDDGEPQLDASQLSQCLEGWETKSLMEHAVDLRKYSCNGASTGPQGTLAGIGHFSNPMTGQFLPMPLAWLTFRSTHRPYNTNKQCPCEDRSLGYLSQQHKEENKQ